jgi:hypothetical protein
MEITGENKETDVTTSVLPVERVPWAAGAIIFAGMEKGIDIRSARAESAVIAVCAAQTIAVISTFSPTALLLSVPSSGSR